MLTVKLVYELIATAALAIRLFFALIALAIVRAVFKRLASCVILGN